LTTTDKLSSQQENERANPEKTIGQLTASLMMGPTNIEAKNTCAMSRDISDRIVALDGDEFISSLIFV